MMFDRERRELRQDQNPDPLADFDLSLIDLIPSERDQKGLKEMHHQEAIELRSGKLKQRMSEVLGKEIAPGEINQLFQFPERGIESQTLMSTGEHSNYLETETILYTRKNGEAQLAGRTNLAFIKGANPILLIRYCELEKTGEQLGIEIQCRLEKFCRDNGIWEILNVARSQPANYFGRGNRSEIGAYVWALCGFEFNSGAEALGVMQIYGIQS
ncbi:MAG: hypothetical protein NT093_00195 [Candidatus Moranbacteria bacterium]|nr:hypothetical protein [Candidatus Moranbacteria bacterium]